MITQRGLRALACGLTMSLFVAVPATAAPTPTRRAGVAVRYIVSRQNQDGSIPALSRIGSTADAALAMVAAGRGALALNDAIRYLRRAVADADLGQRAKVVMAVVASGRNPRSFGGRNLVAQIAGTLQPDGQYFDASAEANEVTYHALAMLALAAARAHIPRRAARWLASAQCTSGGWRFDDPASVAGECTPIGADTNTTSYAVMALNARPSTVTLTADPFAFFRSARDEFKGGWVYDPNFKCTSTTPDPNAFCGFTDANSTGLVLQAHAAEDVRVPAGSRTALADLQYRLCGPLGGAFAYTWEPNGQGGLRRSPQPPPTGDFSGPTALAATIGAVPGLLLKPLPLSAFNVTAAAPRRPRCA